MRKTVVRSMLLSGFALATLGAHEQPTHQAITKAAIDYLSQTDSQRVALLTKLYGVVPFYAALADGSWNEDAYFVGNGCTLATLFEKVPCFLGRFYFHFLPALDDTISFPLPPSLPSAPPSPPPPPPPTIIQRNRATCDSAQWGIFGATCTAEVIPGGPPIGFPVLDNGGGKTLINTHTWQAALAGADATGVPTLAGWRELSYLVHLLEDLTSPPHTRNSAHPCIGGRFCDLLDSLVLRSVDTSGNIIDIPVNLPKSNYIDFANLTHPEDFFTKVAAYTRDHYFSTRTAFKDTVSPDLVSIFEDAKYFYGPCLMQASQDFGMCVDNRRKIAHKGEAYSMSSLTGRPNPQLADIDQTLAREQFAELSPVAVQAVAAFMKFYAPMLTVSMSGNGHGTVTSTSGNLNCTNPNTTPCAILLARTKDGPPSAVLNATPTSDSVFTNWSEGCVGTATSVTVELGNDKSCTANFTLKLTFLGVPSVFVAYESQFGPLDVEQAGAHLPAPLKASLSVNIPNAECGNTLTATAVASLLTTEIPVLTIVSKVEVSKVDQRNSCGPGNQHVGAEVEDDFLVTSGPSGGMLNITFTVTGSTSGSGLSHAGISWLVYLNETPLKMTSDGSANVEQSFTLNVPYTLGTSQHLLWSGSAQSTCSSAPCNVDQRLEMVVSRFQVVDTKGNPISNAGLQTSSGYNYLALQ